MFMNMNAGGGIVLIRADDIPRENEVVDDEKGMTRVAYLLQIEVLASGFVLIFKHSFLS